MYLKQILRATLDDGYTFTAYKSKGFYLVRKTIRGVTWSQFDTFDDVLKALSWFEISVAIDKEEKANGDDGIPF